MKAILILLLSLQLSVAFAAYEQKIYYVGMSCATVQKDSVTYPANEIFINTIIYQPGINQIFQFKHPYTNNVYKNVKNGFVATGPRKLIWRGKQQSLVLGVAMWEHDDGGTKVDVFSSYLTQALIKKVSGMAGKVPPREPGVGVKKDPVTKYFSRNVNNLFGTGNDLVGYDRFVIQKGDYAQKSPRRYKGIEYHIATRHRQGGADCKSYFLFKRGKKYTERQQAKKPQQKHNRQPGINQQQQDASQSHCRVNFDDCANSIRACKENITRHNNRANQCTKHGWKQFEQCVDYYRSPQRNKKYSSQQAKSICRSKYDDYQRGCPQSQSDNCGSYSVCDNRFRNCMNAVSQQQQRQNILLPRQTYQQPAQYRREMPNSRKQYTQKKANKVVLNIVNKCNHINSVALHYRNKKEQWVTKGWYPAYLDRASSATIVTNDTTLYASSGWGKVVDSKKRKNYKQLPVTQKPFEYSGNERLKAVDKKTVKFYPMHLPKGQSKVDLVLSCE